MPTPVRLHRLTPRGTAACALAIASLVAMACTDGTSNDSVPQASPAPPADPTLLVIALPAGVEVGIDDQKPEAPPLAPLPLEPGAHTLHLVTACQQLELPVELAAGTTTRIDPARAKGLALATLEVAVRDLDGKPLAHTVSIGDTVVGAGQGSSKVTVPACKFRVKVASEGLGGFIEDVDFGEQSEVRREVVLAPGPDMVRIHGGAFTLGPPASSERTEARWDMGLPRKDVVLGTFDMDKTEVTAAQFHECRVSGRCSWDMGVAGWPKFPPKSERRFCTTVVDYGLRKPVPGRKDHPMNCVSYHEAEMYCAAVGKRLPTAAEWEYAARSRNPDYYCPWAPPEDVSVESPVCKRKLDDQTIQPGCLERDQNTEQGVCDMLWNVAEYVTHEHVPVSRMEKSDVATRGSYNSCEIEWCVGGENDIGGRTQTFESSGPRSGAYVSSYRTGPKDQDVRIGFRCVRDVMIVQSRSIYGEEE